MAVPGARVFLKGTRHETHSYHDGRYWLHDVPAEAEYCLHAVHPGYEPYAHWFTIPAAALRGVVHDPGLKPRAASPGALPRSHNHFVLGIGVAVSFQGDRRRLNAAFEKSANGMPTARRRPWSRLRRSSEPRPVTPSRLCSSIRSAMRIRSDRDPPALRALRTHSKARTRRGAHSQSLHAMREHFDFCRIDDDTEKSDQKKNGKYQ